MHERARPAPPVERPVAASLPRAAATQSGSAYPATANPAPMRKKSRRRCVAPVIGTSMGHASKCNKNSSGSYLVSIIRDIWLCRKAVCWSSGFSSNCLAAERVVAYDKSSNRSQVMVQDGPRLHDRKSLARPRAWVHSVYLARRFACGRGLGTGDHRPPVGAADAPDSPVADGLVGVSNGRAYTVSARAGGHAPGLAGHRPLVRFVVRFVAQRSLAGLR